MLQTIVLLLALYWLWKQLHLTDKVADAVWATRGTWPFLQGLGRLISWVLTAALYCCFPILFVFAAIRKQQGQRK